MGFEVLTVMGKQSPLFWHVTLQSIEINQCFGGACYVHLQGRISLLPTWFMLVSCLAYSFQKEMSVDFQWTTWHYLQEDKDSKLPLTIFYITVAHRAIAKQCHIVISLLSQQLLSNKTVVGNRLPLFDKITFSSHNNKIHFKYSFIVLFIEA